MRTTDALWETYQAADYKQYEFKAVINGADEYLHSNIFGANSEAALCDTNFSIGNVYSRTLNMSLLLKSTIDKMAYVEPYIRMVGGQGNTAWLPCGKFYIDTRTKSGQAVNFECRDKVLMMEKPFVQSEQTDDFPMGQLLAIEIITARLGITFVNPADLITAYSIDYPGDLTMRQVLGYIAGASSGNFILDDEGNLKFVKAANKVSSAAAVSNTFHEIDDVQCYDLVHAWYDDDNYYAGGAGTNEYIFENPWATQDVATYVAGVLAGYTHRPFECTQAHIDPAIELGDTVTINGVDVAIYGFTIYYGSSVYFDLNSPGNTALAHEYPYKGEYSKTIKGKVSLNAPYFGVKISRTKGLEIARGDGSSEAVFNSENFVMRALENASMVDKIYFDPITGQFVFKGDITARSLTIAADAAHGTSLVVLGDSLGDLSNSTTGYQNSDGVVSIVDGRITADYISAKGFNITNANGYVLLKAMDQVVNIGSFVVSRDVARSYIYSMKSSLDDANNGLYLGTDGIALGIGSILQLLADGRLLASSATISGAITATSFTISNTIANDAGLATLIDVPANISELVNDTGYITNAALPVNISELINDSGYETTTGVVSIIDGTVNADFVNALGITAAAILIKDAANQLIFSASGTGATAEVYAGGWDINYKSLSKVGANGTAVTEQTAEYLSINPSTGACSFSGGYYNYCFRISPYRAFTISGLPAGTLLIYSDMLPENNLILSDIKSLLYSSGYTIPSDSRYGYINFQSYNESLNITITPVANTSVNVGLFSDSSYQGYSSIGVTPIKTETTGSSDIRFFAGLLPGSTTAISNSTPYYVTDSGFMKIDDIFSTGAIYNRGLSNEGIAIKDGKIQFQKVNTRETFIVDRHGLSAYLYDALSAQKQFQLSFTYAYPFGATTLWAGNGTFTGNWDIPSEYLDTIDCDSVPGGTTVTLYDVKIDINGQLYADKSASFTRYVH